MWRPRASRPRAGHDHLGPAARGDRRFRCSAAAFQQPGASVLWLADLIEVRRRGDALGARPGAEGAFGISYEADVVRIDGPGYSRYEHYEVRPRSTDAREWRVIRYEFQGEQWRDDFGGAGRRP